MKIALCILVSFFLISSVAISQEMDPNEIALVDFNKFHKPVVVGGEAMNLYRETGSPWIYIEYEGILIGYSAEQNENKIRNLLELNMFNFTNYKEVKRKNKTAAVYVEDNMFFTDMLSSYVSAVCGVKISVDPEHKKNAFLKYDKGDEEHMCMLFVAALSVSGLEMIRFKDNEFMLKNVSVD